MNRVLGSSGDNLELMRAEPDESVQLAYLDPPFNTGRDQTRRTLATTAATNGGGDRTGFGGRRYTTELLEQSSYRDAFDDYLGFLEPRLREVRRLLHPTGTLYFHIDWREAHYCKLLLDELFGRECFLNELIWAYDYGAKPRRRWPPKHDTILVYVKHPRDYWFDSEAVDREPYMAPGLVTPEKAERGKRPTDVIWHTIVSPTGRGEDGLSHAEAARACCAGSSRPRVARRPLHGPVRGLRNARRGGGESRPPLPADGLERASGHGCRPNACTWLRFRTTLRPGAALVRQGSLPPRRRRAARRRRARRAGRRPARGSDRAAARPGPHRPPGPPGGDETIDVG